MQSRTPPPRDFKMVPMVRVSGDPALGRAPCGLRGVLPPVISRRAPMGTNILIAWSGTSEAAGAVSAALPLLEKADKVTIITVESENSPIQVSAKDLADQLRWHGVSAVHDSMPAERPAGEIISDRAKFHGCDLLVMGAFTHSRLIQIILGGVTRHMMNTSDIPILMSH